MLRFAPSPTADMDIDSLRIAIFNYIVAKQRDEEFIVRIEDTDKEKNIENKDKEILDLLALFDIKYSQIIYQSENVRFHTAMALQLMHEKKAFSCFCSDDWIKNKQTEAKAANKVYKYDDACKDLPNELVIDNTNPFSIRIKRPEQDIIIKDYINGELCFKADTIDSFMIMNQEKKPMYDFACAVDDMLSDISIIIRNKKYLQNTPKQDHIRNSLGYDKKIEYGHIASIQGDKIISVKQLLEDGFLPDAILNYLVSIGNKVPSKIFTIAEAIKWFDLSSVSNDDAHFNLDELRHLNKQYLNQLDDKELSRYVGFADEEIGRLAKVYLEDISTTKELKTKIAAIFTSKEIPNEFSEISKNIAKATKKAPYFEEYEDFKTYIIDDLNLDDAEFSDTFYYLLTGAKNGPDIAMVYKYLKNYIGEIIK